MRKRLCLCPVIPRFELSTKLVLLMHAAELRATTNTGRIAALALAGSEIRERGKKDSPMDASNLVTEGATTLVLFPSTDSIVLTPELVKTLKRPVRLVVPDGTWSQAVKIVRRVPELAGAIRVKLPAGTPTRYRLRQTPHAENLCTLEAIARAFGVLEGAHVQEQLERVFEIMMERSLWSRGLLPLAECRHPIPDAAIQEFHEAGIAGRMAK